MHGAAVVPVLIFTVVLVLSIRLKHIGLVPVVLAEMIAVVLMVAFGVSRKTPGRHDTASDDRDGDQEFVFHNGLSMLAAKPCP